MSDCSDMASSSVRAKAKAIRSNKNSNFPEEEMNRKSDNPPGAAIPYAEFMKWSACSYLKPTSLMSIKLAHIFGSGLEQTVVLVTTDDDVYLVGYNVHGSLGTGSAARFVEDNPIKIDALCKKSLCNFSCGDDGGCLAIMALSEDGQVYGWGYNEYGELGIGAPCTEPVLPTKVDALSHETIKQLCCGADHVLAVTSRGDVYGWGYDYFGQVGDGSRIDVYTPVKISGDFAGKAIAQVACGMYHSVAISEDGDLYTWGRNEYGQLGVGHCKSILTKIVPNKIDMAARIRKISCGSSHTFAITEEGELYAWGQNSRGELGNGKTAKCLTPTRVALELSPIVDIFCVHYATLNVCQTIDNKLYMWGFIRDKILNEPTETAQQRCALDLFSIYSTPPATFKPLRADEMPNNMNHSFEDLFVPVPVISTVPQPQQPQPEQSQPQPAQVARSDSIDVPPTPSLLGYHLGHAFNDPNTADIKFSVEGKILYAHKAILKIRSEYFRELFVDNKCDDNEDYILKIPEIRYSVYRTLLLYFYTDKVEFQEIEFKDVVDLYRLADNIDEVYLRERCSTMIKQQMTTENAVDIYNVAKNQDDQHLEEFAFTFFLDRFVEMSNGDKFASLDKDALFKLLRELNTKKERNELTSPSPTYHNL